MRSHPRISRPQAGGIPVKLGEAGMAKRNSLRGTDIEGVYLNETGEHVDAHGVAIAFKELRAKDRAQRREVLDSDITEPHHLLKALAFDPRLPIHIRGEYAKAAAPYFAAKKLDRGDGPNDSAEEYAAKVREALDQIDTSVGASAKKSLSPKEARK